MNSIMGKTQFSKYAIIDGMKFGLAAAAAVFTLSAFAEKQPFSRYQVILDKEMFGALPHDFDPTKMPGDVVKTNQKELTKEQEALKSAVHFSVINVNPSGEIEVGFSDLSDKATPRHYFLKVGDSQDGWRVEKADSDAATVTLSKGDIVLDLSLGENSASGAGAAKTTASNVQRSSPGLLAGSHMTARQRREKREQELQKRSMDLEKAKEALQADKEESERSREAIRAQLSELKDEIQRVRKNNEESGRGPSESDGAGGNENNDA